MVKASKKALFYELHTPRISETIFLMFYKFYINNDIYVQK